MSEQYENNKCLVHLIFWSHPWSLHPLTYKHNYITFNDHITYTKQNIQLNINSNSCSWNQYVFCECPRPHSHIKFGQAGQEAVTEHVLKLPCSDSSTLFTRRHGDGDTGQWRQEQQRWTTGHIHHTLASPSVASWRLGLVRGRVAPGRPPHYSLHRPPLHWSHWHWPRRIWRDEVRSLT